MKIKIFLTITLLTVVTIPFIMGASRPQVLVFTASWCQPCKDLHNAIDAKEKTGYNKVKFRYVDFDKEKDLVKRFGITSIPTTVYKNKRRVGFRSSKSYFDWVKREVEK